MNKNVLLYNLFPKNCWKRVTSSILQTVPHDDIAVNITIPVLEIYRIPFIKNWLFKKFCKIKIITWTINHKRKGESSGFDKLRKALNYSHYSILTYTHSKGTSRKRKDTQPIRDWTEMMRYFVLDRFELTQSAFMNGYHLAGVNLNTIKQNIEINPDDIRLSNFYFEGNFVSIDLAILRNQFLSTPCASDYYGVETFWGLIDSAENAAELYCSNPFDHYSNPYPPEIYKGL